MLNHHSSDSVKRFGFSTGEPKSLLRSFMVKNVGGVTLMLPCVGEKQSLKVLYTVYDLALLLRFGKPASQAVRRGHAGLGGTQ